MSVFKLPGGVIPNREQMGLGSILEVNHTGPTKRPTEKRAEGTFAYRTEGKRKDAQEYGTKLLACHDDPDLQREDFHELRHEYGQKITPKQMANITAGIALIITARDMGYEGEIDSKGQNYDIAIKNGTRKGYKILTCEGDTLRIGKLPDGATVLEIGDELFDMTAGDPTEDMRKLISDKVLQNHQL